MCLEVLKNIFLSKEYLQIASPNIFVVEESLF